jgi:predicted secreted protein
MSQMKRLTEQFNSISVKKGDYFVVDLPDNGASTGYIWDLTVTAGKARVVKQEYVDPTPSPDDEFMCGKTIYNRTVLQAEESGEIELRADWHRPWESKPPAKSHVFKVSVK